MSYLPTFALLLLVACGGSKDAPGAPFAPGATGGGGEPETSSNGHGGATGTESVASTAQSSSAETSGAGGSGGSPGEGGAGGALVTSAAAVTSSSTGGDGGAAPVCDVCGDGSWMTCEDGACACWKLSPQSTPPGVFDCCVGETKPYYCGDWAENWQDFPAACYPSGCIHQGELVACCEDP